MTRILGAGWDGGVGSWRQQVKKGFTKEKSGLEAFISILQAHRHVCPFFLQKAAQAKEAPILALRSFFNQSAW